MHASPLFPENTVAHERAGGGFMIAVLARFGYEAHAHAVDLRGGYFVNLLFGLLLKSHKLMVLVFPVLSAGRGCHSP